MLGYADWTRDRLRSTLEANVDVWEREIDTMSNYKTIRILTAHMAAAEERWQMRILGQPRPDPGYEDRAGQSIADVFAGWDGFRERTHDLLATATVDDLAVVHHIVFPNFEMDRTVEQMLFQVFNHQTYHLGQISMALQRWGIDPPNFDAILWPDRQS